MTPVSDRSAFHSEPSPVLSPEVPLRLCLADYGERKINRIGIRLGTPPLTPAGTAELRLLASDGQEFRKEFPLQTLKDSEYFFFNLDPNTYRSGQIVSRSNEGIHTWDIVDRKGNAFTDIIYGFTDGALAFSPGAGNF